MKKHLWLDAHEIAPGLWQGSYPLPEAVRDFQVIVYCAREFPPPSSIPGVRLIYAPNDDNRAFPFTKEKLKIAIAAARAVTNEILRGSQVLVTCAAGLNRSGLVSALTLRMLYNWTGSACVARVRKCRKSSRMPYTALSNGEFVQVLERMR